MLQSTEICEAFNFRSLIIERRCNLSLTTNIIPRRIKGCIDIGLSPKTDLFFLLGKINYFTWLLWFGFNVSGTNFTNQSMYYTIDLHSNCNHHQQHLVHIIASDALTIDKNWFFNASVSNSTCTSCSYWPTTGPRDCDTILSSLGGRRNCQWHWPDMHLLSRLCSDSKTQTAKKHCLDNLLRFTSHHKLP